LAEIFTELRKHNTRLTPEKSTFRVRGGRFLAFMLTYRGIEENAEKCEAIITMRSPKKCK